MSSWKIHRKHISDLSIFILCLLMLCSMYPWFSWHYKIFITLLLCLLFFILRLTVTSEKKIELSKVIAIFSGFILFAYLGFRDLNNASSLFNYMRLFAMTLFVITMTDNEKSKLITVVTNIYAWIVGISIVYYILIVYCDVQLPYSIIEYPGETTDYPYFKNYVFLILVETSYSLVRLQSIFMEPGHLGMISAILLYINKYDLSKATVLIILIGLFLSFSLAAYALLVLGYILYELSKWKKVIRRVFLLISGLAVLVFISAYVYTKYDESTLSRLILSRFEYDEEKGIVGNNRSSEHFDDYYERIFLKDANHWITGLGASYFKTKLAGRTSSYKVFFVEYGAIGAMLLLQFYLSIFYISRSRFILGLFLLYCASFWQRPYALWDMQLFLFICAASVFQNKKYDDESKNQLFNNNSSQK